MLRNKIWSAATAAAITAALISCAAVQAYDTSDYYARNFVATNNGIFWEGCAQISWFNAAADPTKVSLYASGQKQTDGSYVLISDTLETEANASVVTTLPTKNWAVTPRAGWYNFKLVSEFEDGTVTEQTLDYFVPNDTFTNSYKYTTHVSDDFATIAQRGGWTYSMSGQGFDFFPMASEVVFEDGNPALKVWSNAHVAANTNETRDGKTNNSGNYYGQLSLQNAVEAGASYDISFRYKAKGIEYLRMQINSKEIDEEISDTQGEWVDYSTTINSATGSSFFVFEFQLGNEEFIIDDVVIKKSGTEENILSDGDFSILASSAPQLPENASVVFSDDNVILSWKDAVDADGVNVYENTGGREIKRAYVRKSKQAVTLKGTSESEYILKSVNSLGVESDSVLCEVPSYTQNELAARELAAQPTGKSGGLLVSWRNSECHAIKRIRLVSSDGEVIADSENGDVSTAANMRGICEINKLTSGKYYTYKLITETDFGSIEQTVSGMPYAVDAGNAYVIPVTDKTRVCLFRPDADSAFLGVRYEMVNEDGTTAMKIINSHESGWAPGNTWFEVGTGKGILGLKSDTAYKVEVRYKGTGYAWQKIFIHDQSAEKGIIDMFTSSVTALDWSTFSKTFTTDSGEDAQGFRLMSAAAANGPLWIDWWKLTEVGTGEVVYYEDFENHLAVCDTPVTNLSAKCGDSKVELTWTAPEESNKYPAKVVRVFVTADGNTYMAASLDPSVESYTVEGLENAKEYTISLDVHDMNGYTSEAATVSATPIAPKYKVSGVSLCDASGNTITTDSLTPGDYKVTAGVKNNEMGSDFTAQLIVCLYDGDTLYAAKSSPVKRIAQTAPNRSPERLVTDIITVPNTSGHSFTIKAYIWDSITKMNKLDGLSSFF